MTFINNSQNNLSKEQLEEVTTLSELLLRPADIAVFLEYPEHLFMQELQDTSSDIYKAFRRGYLKTLITTRKNLLNLSNVSPESNIALLNIIDEYEALIETDKNNPYYE